MNLHLPARWKVKGPGALASGPMRIGEVSEAVSLPTKTIRYYEDIGLLPRPERSANGYRAYDPSACERLRFVKAAQAVGFSLGEIREILAFRERGEEPCAHVLDLVDRRARYIAERIAALERMRADLQQLAARGRALRGRDGSYCHIIEAASR